MPRPAIAYIAHGYRGQWNSVVPSAVVIASGVCPLTVPGGGDM